MARRKEAGVHLAVARRRQALITTFVEVEVSAPGSASYHSS
jgi:hypothetical protein